MLSVSQAEAGVVGWEAELLAPEELMPLTQTLIPPNLASAFSIELEPPTSASEIRLASELAFQALCLQGTSSCSLEDARLFSPVHDCSLPASQSLIPDRQQAENMETPGNFLDHAYAAKDLDPEGGSRNQMTNKQITGSTGKEDATAGTNGSPFVSSEKRVDTVHGSGIGGTDSSEYGAGKRSKKRLDAEFEDVDSGVGLENSNEEPAARTLKRPRLVWTPQLHKRFVEAVAHLGIKNAVPKTIMQLMSVEGLTRENVASHLQKYRLYLKRMQGLSTDGPSVSDQLFASTPVPPSLAASAHFLSNHGEDILPLLMPVPMVGGMSHGHAVGPLGSAAPYTSFDHHVYNAFGKIPSSQRLLPTHGEYDVINQQRPASPQRRVLPLFPANGQ